MEEKINGWNKLINYYFETNDGEKKCKKFRESVKLQFSAQVFREAEGDSTNIGVPHWVGKEFYRHRVAKTAEWAVENYDGDIIEIGAHLGETTVKLCEVAKKYNRKVIVIDPWDANINGIEEPAEYLSDDAYKIFLENTKDYHDILEIIKKSSFSDEALKKTKNREFCFALIDGCHTSKALINDLTLVKNCNGAIGIDDINYHLWCNVCKQHYSLYSVFTDFPSSHRAFSIHFRFMAEGYIFTDAEFARTVTEDIYKVIPPESMREISSGPLMFPGQILRLGGMDWKVTEEGKLEVKQRRYKDRTFHTFSTNESNI